MSGAARVIGEHARGSGDPPTRGEEPIGSFRVSAQPLPAKVGALSGGMGLPTKTERETEYSPSGLAYPSAPATSATASWSWTRLT